MQLPPTTACILSSLVAWDAVLALNPIALNYPKHVQQCKKCPQLCTLYKSVQFEFWTFLFLFFLSQETCVSIGKAGQGRMGRLTLWFTFLWQAAKISFFRNRMYLKINRFLPRMTLHWWFLLETQLALGVRGLQRDSSSCPDWHR